MNFLDFQTAMDEMFDCCAVLYHCIIVKKSNCLLRGPWYVNYFQDIMSDAVYF